MTILFLNGPVQNGDFALSHTPGKAVGIRIAGALNAILGNPPMPHLWNTVTLSGDLRYRRHSLEQASPLSRQAFEAASIARKYRDGMVQPVGVVTDTDPIVTDLALNMVKDQLSRGTLTVSAVTVQVCTRCGHMVGTGRNPCKACGSTSIEPRSSRHLIVERDPQEPVFDIGDVYTYNNRPPKHLLNIARNVPASLILSRTRDHGIDLAPIGLPGLVLDPRVGVHITVLAVAQKHGFASVVMTTTQNAAANIAAYGQLFRQYEGLRMRYALHGHVPYTLLPSLQGLYAPCHLGDPAQTTFETWFLPLAALKSKAGVTPDQIPPLLKYFQRVRFTALTESRSDQSKALHALHQAIKQGDTDWIARKVLVARALRIDESVSL